MKTAVVLKDNVVKNIIVIDENTPEDMYDVELKNGDVVSIGYLYKRGKFVKPKETEEN